jgi:hypothetical protein
MISTLPITVFAVCPNLRRLRDLRSHFINGREIDVPLKFASAHGGSSATLLPEF